MNDLLNNHLLSVVIFLPMLGALLLLLLPVSDKKNAALFGLGFSFVEFVLSLKLYFDFKNTGSFEFMELMPWIPAFKVQYFIGIDGVSLLLILLTTLLFPCCFLASLHSIKDRARGFVISMLVLETGILGVFAALDLFLFYVFWEVMLLPMYFIIGVWGGQDRIYASVKFFLYTMAGSVLMLVGILYLYGAAGSTFNLLELYEYRLPFQAQFWVFLAFAVAFAIKVPLFPFHTWLPDAHVQAPTAGSVILAGVLLKMGTYGFFRFAMPLFPDALHVAQPYLIALSVFGIVYGALVALVQTDMKKLIAYSSVSHLGVVMLGIFALEKTAITGGLYQMLNHGVSTGALFLLVGVLYDRTHSREIAAYGGLAKKAPWYAALFIVVSLSSAGLPLTNGFIGEFLSLAGAFQVSHSAAIVGTTGVILSALYLLWLIERVFFGKEKLPESAHGVFPDVSLREIAVFIPFLLLIFWMGLFPNLFLDKITRPVEQVLLQMENKDVNTAN